MSYRGVMVRRCLYEGLFFARSVPKRPSRNSRNGTQGLPTPNTSPPRNFIYPGCQLPPYNRPGSSRSNGNEIYEKNHR
jgi:hypothetical protein